MEDLKVLASKEILTNEEFNTLWESNFTNRVESIGMSGKHYGYEWFEVEFIDGDIYEVYTKF